MTADRQDRTAMPGDDRFDAFADPRGEDFSLGVEEEFFVVDARTREPRPLAEAVLARTQAPDEGAVAAELKRSQVELGSAVCHDLDDLRSSLTDIRGTLDEAARHLGARLAALGTHPWSRWGDDGGVTREAAYLRLDRMYGLLAEEQAVCGCHVHVGIHDPEVAIDVMNRLRGAVPVLVALTGNSPFWMGRDTGYRSFRTQVFHRWPTAGIPEHLRDRQDYDQAVDLLRRTGAIDSPARLYWDIRPSHRYPTLEFRAADVALTVDDAVALAATIRALVQTAYREAERGAPLLPPRPELLRSALWRASRFGLAGRLIDVDGAAERPAAQVVGATLERIAPVLRERGELDVVRRWVTALLDHGTGADRQRAAVQTDGDLAAAVDVALI